MAKPDVERHGDSFILTWHDVGISFGIERMRDSKYDGLIGELIIEAIPPYAKSGRVLGPINLKLQSSEDQERKATLLSKRINTLTPGQWHGMMIQACAMVARDWRESEPIIDMASYEDSGTTDYLIPVLVPESETTVLYGDGESGKSLLALMMAMCVRTSAPMPWGAQPHTGNVLYLDWETNPKTVASRIKRIAEGIGIDKPSIFYRQCFRSLQDEQPTIREEIARKQVRLVVVDSIGFAANGSLTDDETARTSMNILRSFAPATRLVVAHVSKSEADKEKGRARPFGSVFFWNGMRSGIEVRRVQEQYTDGVIEVGLFHQKSNDGTHHRPIMVRILFNGLDGPVTIGMGDITEVDELAARVSLTSRMRVLLKSGALTTSEIAEELDAKESVVRNMLRRMPDAIQIKQGGGRGNPSTWGLQDRA